MRSPFDPSDNIWATVWQRHRGRLTTYALGLTGHDANAEDLLQDVLVRLVRSRKQPGDALTYLMRCLRNRWIDRLRARDATAEPLDAAHLDALYHAAPPDEPPSLRAALAACSPAQRETIVLRIHCEMTFQQVADILQLPLGTVTSHYARGLACMRHTMEEHIHVP